MGLFDIGPEIMEAMGKHIESAGGVLEKSTSAVAGVVRNAIKEFADLGVSVEDAAEELVEGAVRAVTAAGGDAVAASAEALGQVVEAAGELGADIPAAVQKGGSGALKAVGDLGQDTIGAVSGTIGAVMGKSPEEDPEDGS